MASFFLRVQLHKADANHYEQLHAALQSIGYLRALTIEGVTRKLPEATYHAYSATTFWNEEQKVEGAIKSVGREYWLLLIERESGKVALRSEPFTNPGYGMTEAPTTKFLA